MMRESRNLGRCYIGNSTVVKVTWHADGCATSFTVSSPGVDLKLPPEAQSAFIEKNSKCAENQVISVSADFEEYSGQKEDNHLTTLPDFVNLAVNVDDSQISWNLRNLSRDCEIVVEAKSSIFARNIKQNRGKKKIHSNITYVVSMKYISHFRS